MFKEKFSRLLSSTILTFAVICTITTTITIIDNPFTDINQKAYADEIVGQEGVNDNLVADGEDVVWGDSSGSVDSSFVPGDDTITATGSDNFLAGDSDEMINSQGGDDTITSTSDANVLFGDSGHDMINSQGGAGFSNCNK